MLVGTVRYIPTWRKMTVAVCLETALRISGEAAMTDRWNDVQFGARQTNQHLNHDHYGKQSGWPIPNIYVIGRHYKDRSPFEKGAEESAQSVEIGGAKD